MTALAIAPRANAGMGTAEELTAGVRMTYDNTPKLETNIPGIKTFPKAPEGFDPVRASDIDLARYGFPPRPDATLHPDSYRSWERAMSAARTRSTAPLVLTDRKSTNMNRAPTRPNAAAITGTNSVASYNWSGIANVTGITAYTKTYSFYYVISDFNVPVAQQAFGACDGYYDLEASWNGIDGYNNDDVLQGGSLSEAYCSGGSTAAYYVAWYEWYPSYPIIEAFGVNPGDDLYVETFDTGARQGYVYLEDETTGYYNEYSITPKKGEPSLLGNSAEYIVERPCCLSNGDLYPLANYVQNFWVESDAYLFKQGSHYYPGQTGSTTYIISMLDDAGDQYISVPMVEGTDAIFFHDQGCAYSGGCTE